VTDEPVPPRAFFSEVAEPQDADASWIGIEIEPVPPPVAAHLTTGPAGLMIRNVFKDSPADHAGLERYDVLLKINERKVTPDTGEFMDYVHRLAPGDTVKFEVLRAGAIKEVTLQTARRPARMEPKYPPEPGKEPYDFRGRIFRRGPDGWILEDLGPIPAPGEFPGRIRNYADKLFNERVPPPPPGEPAEARHVTREGEVLVVQREPDGKIRVKRYRQENGEQSAEVRTYANADELEAADRQAFDLLRDAEKGRLPLAPPGGSPEAEHRFQEYMEEALRRYEDAVRDIERRTEQYQQELREWRERLEREVRRQNWPDRWNQWRDRFFQGPLEELRPVVPRPTTKPCPGPHEAPPPPPAHGATPGALAPPGSPPQPQVAPPPNVRFDVKPNGNITVYLRHKDAEITRTYASEEALREQAPRVYERYQDLQNQFH